MSGLGIATRLNLLKLERARLAVAFLARHTFHLTCNHNVECASVHACVHACIRVWVCVCVWQWGGVLCVVWCGALRVVGGAWCVVCAFLPVCVRGWIV